MNDDIVYYPYKAHKWFIPLAVVSGIIHLIATISCINHALALSCFFMIMSGFSVFLAVVLYNTSKSAVFFNSQGLIIREHHASDKLYSWKEFPYAYYIRNYKGHVFLVLAYNKLDYKQAKLLVTSFINAFRIRTDDAVVIYLDILQNVTQIKNIAEQKLTVHCFE